MEYIESFVQQLARMQWSDYLDIILVALVFYRVIRLFQSETTKRIFVALIAVAGIYIMTDFLHLYAINFILNQFLAVGILALVILFQPELRRMLDHLGSVRLNGLFGTAKPVEEMEAIISQVVAACEVMSREKVGALIVFAREIRLEEYFKTGTVIDGRVSEQLIRNIFFPKASLHDGAMIIRDGRVAAAGCVLPLTENTNVSADLGTRHRAGMGMSEVSDAVVVIVSEETGTISAAINGVLKRPLDLQTLEKLLIKELCPSESTEGEQTLSAFLKKTFLKAGKEMDRDEK